MPKQEKTDRTQHVRSAKPRGKLGGGSAFAKPNDKINMEEPWHQTKSVKIRYARDRRATGAGVSKGMGAKKLPLA